jgi:molybdate transport system substrate-binding protein
MPRRRPSLVVLAAATLVVLTAVPARATRPTAPPRGSITVSAAASLTEAFTRLGQSFEKRNPKATITFNFGSSSALVSQIQGGAPADVFASADLASMDEVVSGGQVTSTPTPFARNQMEIALKPGNPERVKAVADLATIGTIALCGAAAPCGVYAARVLERANVTVRESSITRGVDAKATLGAVSQGDANAAIVYTTDVKAAGTAVSGVAIPEAQNVAAVYPIAPIADSDNPKLAKAFTAYVVSPAGQKTLARYGFLAP